LNNNLVVSKEEAWALRPYGADQPAVRGQRVYSAINLLDLSTLLRILFHWRWLVLGATAFGVILAILSTLLANPLYRATVSLEANPPSVSISDEQAREREEMGYNSYDMVATQVGLLESRNVAERTAQDLNLANNPEIVDPELPASDRLRAATDFVAGGLKVIPPEEGRLIKFNFVSQSPQLAATVANGIADNFINSALQRRYESSAYARNFLERQINKTRSDLERSERQLVAYAQKQGIVSSGGGGADGKSPSGDTGSLQGDSLFALNAALAEATARRVAAEGAYRGSMSTGPTSDVTTSTAALRQDRARLQAEYQQKREFMKPEHPEMESLQAQIDELDRQIVRESSTMSSGRNNSLLADYRAALAAERALQGRVASLKGDVLDLRGRSIQYNILQREVDTNRSLYDALLQRYKEIGVAGGIGVAPVSIVDRADAPILPFKPQPLLNLLLGLALGFLAGVAAAVGLEVVNDTIKSREDVRKKLDLSCLGIVPKSGGKDGFLEELKNPTSHISEAYSALIAALRYSTEDGMPKVLALTSAGPGEGKSSSAFAVAQTCARLGRRVLLIDSDLRKPAFKTENDDVGLSHLLTTDDPLADHLLPTQHENLTLLPSGPVPPNPADLLSTGRLRRIIAEAGETFDLVLIDAPPTLGLADSPLLAAAAGNTIFIVEAGKTRTRAVIDALNRLETVGTHILGVVLTKAAGRGGNYGGYGYGYGHAYGKGARLKRTEILMIPKESDAGSEARDD
jgi:capsular exopolysaccharide synthesis family protein